MSYCINVLYHSQAEGTKEDKGKTEDKETQHPYQMANTTFNSMSSYVTNSINQRRAQNFHIFNRIYINISGFQHLKTVLVTF